MVNYNKLKKAELIALLNEKAEQVAIVEEYKFDLFKQELGMPYDNEVEWINYIKKLQDLNAERLNDCERLTQQLAKANEIMMGYICQAPR
jgi:hypothetical protein